MGEVSYSAHISNGKSAITNKSKLQGVANHNLRKYKSTDYSSENIIILTGTKNLYQDVRNIYDKEFDDAVKLYNEKQKRAERRIDDYFEHVSKLDQDMAVEIIFQCGDKKFWEEHDESKERMFYVYNYILQKLEEYLPDFKIANAVIHFDEASPHMHVVGVPVWNGAKRGLEKKVSKRNVFTPETLSVVLQDKLREEARSCFKFNVNEIIGDKKKGRNYDLSVTEYKVKQEHKKLFEVMSEKNETEDLVFSAKCKLDELKLQYDEDIEEIKKGITDKKRILKDLDTELDAKRFIIEITDDEIKEKEGFLKSFEDVEKFIQSYLPLKPEIEEFANTVERGERLDVGSSYRGVLTALGELLRSFKELLQAGLCWFPRLMRWNTSKGEVAPVFRDDNDGYSYKLEGFRNTKTNKMYSTEDLKNQIYSKNRIGTLDQMYDSVKLLEKRIEENIDSPEQRL